MVKTELAYNPYLLETNIRFNGQSPRINSLVEKYQDGILQNWIKLLPSIFHDEMNGYDFELEFSGTPRDFSELELAFKQAGVTEDQVQLFHKNELEERSTKLQRIEALLSWLADNPNENFDNEQFRKDNELLFDGAYSFVVIQGEDAEQPTIEWTDASVEVIKDVRELNNTDLTYTPIIISLTESKVYELQKIIKYLSKKTEVSTQQIFFKIEDIQYKDSIYRVIKDLGIAKPQFIKSFSDESLKKYFEIYPETDYIINSIKMFRKAISDVETVLSQEKALGEKTNNVIDEQIIRIEEQIQSIREADEDISARNNIDKPAAFTTAKNIINNRLTGWRKKKTKTTVPEEAEKLASELFQETQNNLDEFLQLIDASVLEVKAFIDDKYGATYASSGLEDQFSADGVEMEQRSSIELPWFVPDLEDIKIEEKVLKKTVGLFYIPSKNPDDDYEMQTAYYLQKWREHVFSIIDPIVDHILNERLSSLADYNERLKAAYHEHLEQAIIAKIDEETELSKQLSSEEKRLQHDGAWLSYYKQQLKAIERG